MHQETITVTHEGWFMFCPIYMADADSDCPSPIPKGGAWWLLDLAGFCAYWIGWFVSFIDPDAGGFCFSLTELPEPLEITITVQDDTE